MALNGCSSDWTEVASGVPQGSVFGPLLFLVFINDMPESVLAPVSMFADDSKLYCRANTSQEVAQLQSDIQALVKWSDTWQLPFNESKCKVLHLGRNNPNSQYMMRATELSAVQIEKDLCVHTDSELKFRHHASAVVAKTHSDTRHLIRRSFVLIHCRTFPLLFKALVRPHLD